MPAFATADEVTDAAREALPPELWDYVSGGRRHRAHAAAQPERAGLGVLPAAGGARRVGRAGGHDVPRDRVLLAGAARADRDDRAVRRGRRGHAAPGPRRGPGTAAFVSILVDPVAGGGRGDGRAADLPALHARLPRVDARPVPAGRERGLPRDLRDGGQPGRRAARAGAAAPVRPREGAGAAESRRRRPARAAGRADLERDRVARRADRVAAAA